MARTSGRHGRPWRRAVQELKTRTQICALCGDAIDLDLKFPDPMSFTADHIIPLSKLDHDDPRRTAQSNLQAAHLVCNQRKNNRAATPQNLKRELKTTRRWIT